MDTATLLPRLARLFTALAGVVACAGFVWVYIKMINKKQDAGKSLVAVVLSVVLLIAAAGACALAARAAGCC